ncbi:MAG: hypothetical protein ACD_31C00068G0001 [uncultured bacterium]|nr:MAG: hypothetical protein ACD_31C00068G0001 [uncultured bacterium]
MVPLEKRRSSPPINVINKPMTPAVIIVALPVGGKGVVGVGVNWLRVSVGVGVNVGSMGVIVVGAIVTVGVDVGVCVGVGDPLAPAIWFPDA